MSESRTRKVTMTVYKIEADLLDVTTWGQVPGSAYLHGRVMVSARDGNDEHSWPLMNGEQCWVGDRVEVTIIEPAPSKPTRTPLTAPPKDTR